MTDPAPSKIARIGAVLAVAALGLVLFQTSSALAGPPRLLGQGDAGAGAAVYAQDCASCHQADGSGIPAAFPPLTGNPASADSEYVEDVVRNGLSGPLEVLGESYDADMPAVSQLSDDDVANVVAYVATLADRDPDATPATTVVEAEPGDPDEGHALFVGSDRFDNGGAACVGCHTAGKVGNLGGWSLGPDLTDSVSTLGGEAGLAAWLVNPASATMRPVFADHAMTEDEIADVVAFLGEAPEQSKPSDPGDGLILAGVAGLLVLIGGMAVAWRGMRQTYADRLRSKR